MENQICQKYVEWTYLIFNMLEVTKFITTNSTVKFISQ